MTETLRSALRTELAAIATFLIVGAACLAMQTGASPAVIAAVIAVTLSRRSHEGKHQHFIVDAAGLAVVAVAAAAVGLLLRANLALGATAFTVALGGSILLRGINDDARLIGGAIALPFIVLLVVPPPTDPRPLARLLVAVGPLIALAIVRAFNSRTKPAAAAPSPATPRKSSLQPPPHVRMALQMFAALALSFFVGGLAFAQHWPWIVLSAFIVCSGALGRADALYKGILRLSGAIGGTLVSAIVASFIPRNGIIDTILVFTVLFIGLALRERNYAYWAACTTLIFAVLQGADSSNMVALYATRLGCIAIGAAIGILATWLIYPMRTTDVARRRLADALNALERSWTDAGANAEPALASELRALERLVQPLRFHAPWVQEGHAIIAAARPSSSNPDAIPAIRNVRRAIRDRDDISDALSRLRYVLSGKTLLK